MVWFHRFVSSLLVCFVLAVAWPSVAEAASGGQAPRGQAIEITQLRAALEATQQELATLRQDVQALQQRVPVNVAELQGEVSRLESRVSTMGRRIRDRVTEGMFAFLVGCMCALWAQNTGRSAWLWFFYGLLLAPIALVAMLWSNADDVEVVVR